MWIDILQRVWAESQKDILNPKKAFGCIAYAKSSQTQKKAVKPRGVKLAQAKPY